MRMTRQERFDILITGGVANSDLIFAEQLSRRGLKCTVLRPAPADTTERTLPADTYSSYQTHFPADHVRFYSNGFEFLSMVYKCELILSVTGGLLRGLGPLLWPIRSVLRLPPSVNVTTGSDITELAAEKSLRGFVYRQYLGFVDLNWCVPYPHAVKNIFALRIPNAVFMRFPYYLLGEVAQKPEPPRGNRIRFFHPSHLDWKLNDAGTSRNSSKGNDRFIRAFARAIRQGLDAECVFLDRGKDRDAAKSLLRELGVGDRAIWRAELPRDELLKEIVRADVVVDQFDVGGLGGIATEAMSLSKPVMIHLDQGCAGLIYAEQPPVLNCHTEEEIYRQILDCKDWAALRRLGSNAREWVYRYHHWSTCFDLFLFHFTRLTGRKVVDYGWDRDPYDAVTGERTVEL
jgi:glycosyltransferase involved in cell wall biosynthesis